MPYQTEYHSLGEMLVQQATKRADAPFLHFPPWQQSISYQQQLQRCQIATEHLKSAGLQQGQHIALLLPNSPFFVDYFLGAMAMGLVVVPLNTGLKAQELAFILENAEVQLVVSTCEFEAELVPAVQGFSTALPIIWLEDSAEASGSLTAKALQPDTALFYPPEVNANTPAMIIYTSGTTGKPKGVVLSHGNFMVDAASIIAWFGMDHHTVLMNILPLFHVNGEVVTLITPWLCGGQVVLNRKFSAKTFWQSIAHYGVTAFSTVPTILSILLEQGTPALPVPSLQFCICGAAPLPVSVHQQFEATFSVPVIEGYGLSETTCYSSFNGLHDEPRRYGSIGKAVCNKLAVWNEHNQPVPIGQEGELVASGPNVMLEYFKRPEANVDSLIVDANGQRWFKTGDWGRQDEDGYFYLLDRVKDIIIRGGENIMPREIDECLYRHPEVAHAATIGIPDPKYGEAVCSVVVLKPQASSTSEDLIAYCQQHLAGFKCPSRVIFVDDIPKGPTGKLLRRALREQVINL